MRVNLLSLTFLYFFLLLSVFSLAQECVTPYENIAITNSTTFCAGTYYLNDTDANGAVRITGSNLTLDCNYSSFIGNNTSGSKSIWVEGSNVVVRNCKISNYTDGVVIVPWVDNVSIENLEIKDCEQLIHAESNISVRNSTLNSTVLKAIEFLNGKNLTIENSILNYYPPSWLGIHMNSVGSTLRLVNTTIRSYGSIHAIDFPQDNVTVICENSDLIGNDTYIAMAFRDRSGIAVSGCDIRDWWSGIETSDNARVDNVDIRNVKIGIMVRGSNLAVENIYCENMGDSCINAGDGGVKNISITNLEINQTFDWSFGIYTGSYGFFNSTIRNVYAYAPTVIQRLLGIRNSSGIHIYNITSYNFTHVVEVYEGSSDVYIDGVYAQENYVGTLITIHNNSNDITFTNAKIEKANTGIELGDCSNIRVYNVEISDIGFRGIGGGYDAPVYNITVENIVIYNCGDHAIGMDYGDWITIRNLTTWSTDGVNLPHFNHSRIYDSYIESVARIGIKLGDSLNPVVRNNVLYKGIWMEGSRDGVIESNTIYGTGFDLCVIASPYNLSVVNNTCINSSIALYGCDINNYIGHTIVNNKEFGRDVVYYYNTEINESGEKVIIGGNVTGSINNFVGRINLGYSHVTINNSNLHTGRSGIYIFGGNVDIWNVNIHDTYWGMFTECDALITLYDSAIHDTARADIYTESRVTLVNTTYSTHMLAENGRIIRKWWLRLALNVEADVNIYDTFNNLEFSGTLQTAKIPLTHYDLFCNYTDATCVETTVTYTPHMINVTKSGYYPNSTTVVMDDNREVYLTLFEIPVAPPIPVGRFVELPLGVPLAILSGFFVLAMYIAFVKRGLVLTNTDLNSIINVAFSLVAIVVVTYLIFYALVVAFG